ncbi:MAG: hypothetical protein AB8B71_13320 [Paracoccaceae bacterium]
MSWWRVLKMPFARRTYVPLAARRPDLNVHGANSAAPRVVPLGMEALDLDLVEKAARRNDALERVAGAGWTGNNATQENRATYVRPMPQDETYAAAYHAACNTKKGAS